MNEKTPQLKPALGLAALTLFGVGDILGSGVYVLVGDIGSKVGTAAWLSFVIAAVVAGLTGLTYAELSSRYPKAGGAAHYTHQIFNMPFLTFFIIFFVAMSGLFSFATAATVVARYGMLAFPDVSETTAHFLSLYVLPFLFIGLIGIVCGRGVELSSWMNVICTVVEVAVLALIIFVGFRFLGTQNLTSVQSDGSTWSSSTVLLGGASMAFFAFVGFEDLANLAEEARNPRRDIPIAICLAVVITSIIYCLLTAIATSVMTPTALGQTKTPLMDITHTAAGWVPPKLFSIVPIFAVFNTGLLNLIMASRLMYGMARRENRLLPGILSWVHPRYKTPLISVIFGCLIVIVMILSRGDIGVLAGGTTTFLLIVFAVLHLGLLRLKMVGESHEGLFTVWKIVPLLGLITSIVLLMNRSKLNYQVAGALIVVASILFAINRLYLGKRDIEPVD